MYQTLFAIIWKGKLRKSFYSHWADMGNQGTQSVLTLGLSITFCYLELWVDPFNEIHGIYIRYRKKKKGCFFSAVKLFPTLDLSENILLFFFKVTTQIVCKKTKKFKSTVFLQSARSADYKFYSVWMTHYLQSIFFSSIFHVQFTTDQTGNMLNP